MACDRSAAREAAYVRQVNTIADSAYTASCVAMDMASDLLRDAMAQRDADIRAARLGAAANFLDQSARTAARVTGHLEVLDVPPPYAAHHKQILSLTAGVAPVMRREASLLRATAVGGLETGIIRLQEAAREMERFGDNQTGYRDALDRLRAAAVARGAAVTIVRFSCARAASAPEDARPRPDTSATAGAPGDSARPGALDAEVSRYCNARFEFCADVPTRMAADEPPTNGDGQRFTARDGAELTLSGGNIVEEGEALESYRARAKADLDSVSLDQRGPNWYAIAGMSGQTYVYEKTFVGTQATNTIRVEHASDPARWAPVIAWVVRSFRPGGSETRVTGAGAGGAPPWEATPTRPRPFAMTPSATTTTLTVGQQDQLPRVFVSGRYLERGGWTPGTPIRLSITPGQVVIERAPASRKCVNPRGKQRLPVIDLNSHDLASAFQVGEQLHVRVDADRIVVTLAPLAQRVRARRRDGTCGSVFSGAGLLDEAAHQAGFTPAWAIEVEERYADLFAQNHPTAHVVHASIEEAVLGALLAPETSPLRPVELLLAGVPCQPFSRVRTTTSAQEKRAADAGPGDHDLIDMTAWLLSLIAIANPRTIVVECVAPYLASESCAALRRALARLGYHVEAREVDGHEYGELMGRARTALVALTPAADGTAPSPWLPAPQTPTRTVADVLDPEVPADAWIARDVYPHLFARSEANKAKGRGFSFQIVRPEQTRMGTMTGEYGEGRLRVDQPVIAHPERGDDVLRAFSIAEGKRLFGLEEGFRLPDAKTPAWHVLGQAVLVPVWRDVIGRATGRVATARQLVREALGAAERAADPSSAGAPSGSPFGDLPLFAA